MWHWANVEIGSYEHPDLPVRYLGCDKPDGAGQGKSLLSSTAATSFSEAWDLISIVFTFNRKKSHWVTYCKIKYSNSIAYSHSIYTFHYQNVWFNARISSSSSSNTLGSFPSHLSHLETYWWSHTPLFTSKKGTPSFKMTVQTSIVSLLFRMTKNIFSLWLSWEHSWSYSGLHTSVGRFVLLPNSQCYPGVQYHKKSGQFRNVIISHRKDC